MPGRIKQLPDIKTWNFNRRIALKTTLSPITQWEMIESVYKERLQTLHQADVWLESLGRHAGTCPRERIFRSEFPKIRIFDITTLRIYQVVRDFLENTNLPTLQNVFYNLLGLGPNDVHVRGDERDPTYKRFIGWLIWSLSFIWYTAPGHWTALMASLKKRTDLVPEKPPLLFAYTERFALERRLTKFDLFCSIPFCE